jgi:putative hydrolase of HD superfamily
MQELIDFFLKVGELKEIPKRGWVLVGVRDPESVMEHSFQVAILAWILGKEKRVKLDTERILKIALTHDLCELYAGDETPYDKILPKDEKEWPELFDKWPRATKREKARRHKEKHQREVTSLRKLLGRLPLSVREEILELWLDYEQGKTKEARFVRQVNIIQTLLQALDYGE